nr:PH domain-containing protein [Candidatus Baldrarchaeota archaeon]
MSLYISLPPQPGIKMVLKYASLLVLLVSVPISLGYIFIITSTPGSNVVLSNLPWIIAPMLLCYILCVLAISILPYKIRYEIHEDGVTIKGLLLRKKIFFKELKNVSLMNSSEVERSISKAIGINMPGCLRYGLFTTSGGMEKVKVYATMFDHKALILETTGGEKIIISPKDPVTFKQKLDMLVKRIIGE